MELVVADAVLDEVGIPNGKTSVQARRSKIKEIAFFFTKVHQIIIAYNKQAEVISMISE